MPDGRRIVELPFPVRGLDRRMAFGKQPPQTTPACLNVRAEGVFAERVRGGSRPGLENVFGQNIGTGPTDPVRLLASVRAVETTGSGQVLNWFDDFSGYPLGDVGGAWSSLGGAAVPVSSGELTPDAVATNLAADASEVLDTAVVRSVLTDFDVTGTYTISVYVAPLPINILNLGVRATGRFRIYARLDETTPDYMQDGVRLTFDKSVTGTTTGMLEERSGGSQGIAPVTLDGGTEDQAIGGWLSITFQGDIVTAITWRGTDIRPSGNINLTASTKPLIGFGIERFSFFPGDPPTYIWSAIDTFKIAYTPVSGMQPMVEANRTFLVAAAGNKIVAETIIGEEIETISAQPGTSPFITVNPNYQVHARERGGVLYIADHGGERFPVVASGTGANINGFTLTDGGALFRSIELDQGTTGLHTNSAFVDYVVVVTTTSGTADSDVYTISAVPSDTTITLDDNGSGSQSSSTVDYRIVRAPKKYNPITGTLEIWKGGTFISNDVNLQQIPTGCPIIAVFRDRMVLAGAPDAPQVWHMSRVSDPEDWDTSGVSVDGDTSDPARPVSGVVADAGQMPEPITAMIAFSDDYLVIASVGSLWVLRGDPGFNANVDNLSRSIGIIQKGAWCHGPEGELYFLSRQGLYWLAPGAGSFPKKLSDARLPHDLQNVDTVLSDVTLVYDVDDGGIWIHVTRRDFADSTPGTHFWFNLDLQAFFPISYPSSSVEPTVGYRYDASLPTEARVLVGTKHSKIMRYNDALDEDDFASFDDYVLIGPFMCAENSSHEGMLHQLWGALSSDSTNVTWELYVADTAEEAVEAAKTGNDPFDSGTLTNGNSGRYRPRARGFAAVIRLNGGSGPWALERLHAVLLDRGILRV